MASNSDNQILASRARAQERQGQYEGGHWNQWQSRSRQNYGGRPGVGSVAGGSFNEPGRFNRGQILDQRIKKFDKKGRKVDMFEDEFCSFICVAFSFPEAKAVTILQTVCILLVLAGENPGSYTNQHGHYYGASQLEHHPTTGKGGCKWLRFDIQIHGHQRRQSNKDDWNELQR